MILSDIVELNLTPKQETEIISLCDNDERFILATERDIEHCGVDANNNRLLGYNAEHAYKILSKYDDISD